jgi:hypothetical protein
MTGYSKAELFAAMFDPLAGSELRQHCLYLSYKNGWRAYAIASCGPTQPR